MANAGQTCRHRAGVRGPRSRIRVSGRTQSRDRRVEDRRGRAGALLRADDDARPGGRSSAGTSRTPDRQGTPPRSSAVPTRCGSRSSRRSCWWTRRRTARAVCEETFGPTVTVRTVEDVDEAVKLANATGYGLAASVYAGPTRRGTEIARRLRTGMVSVNAVIAFAGIPSLPFGGVGESGFGRIHGEDGLREFASRAVGPPTSGCATPMDPATFRRTAKTMEMLDRYVGLRFREVMRGLRRRRASRRSGAG
ncbi:aldehyde dehydrogenase family protein [Yinghuangia aomiensis]